MLFPPLSPQTRIGALLDRLDRREARLKRRSLRFSRVRLALVLAGVFAALVVGQAVGAGWGWLVVLAVLAVFIAVVRVHDRVEAAHARTRLYRTLQQRHLARLDLDWDALPTDPSAPPPDHPFASDLDVVGPRSLLALLSTAGTRGGNGRLREWLLAASPDPESARERQAQVQALVPHRRFRERLALLGHEAAHTPPYPPHARPTTGRWSDRALRTWLAAPPPTDRLKRWAFFLLAHAATTFGLILWPAFGGPSLWGYSLLLYLALYGRLYRDVADVFGQSHDLQRALREIIPMLLWMERSPALRSEPLRSLQTPFQGNARPSQHLATLRRIASATGWTKNEVGRIVLNVLLPYDLLLWLALARLRRSLSGQLAPWLDALYDAEALSALATHADLHPDAVAFPELLDEEEGVALFDAAALRHPVLRDEQAVGNDLVLTPGEVLILTGSNMAGKSTFLRAVGLASVLAWAGGAVPARSLRLCPLRPVASMRIGDQLQEGLSTFRRGPPPPPTARRRGGKGEGPRARAHRRDAARDQQPGAPGRRARLFGDAGRRECGVDGGHARPRADRAGRRERARPQRALPRGGRGRPARLRLHATRRPMPDHQRARHHAARRPAHRESGGSIGR